MCVFSRLKQLYVRTHPSSEDSFTPAHTHTHTPGTCGKVNGTHEFFIRCLSSDLFSTHNTVNRACPITSPGLGYAAKAGRREMLQIPALALDVELHVP